MSTCLKAIPVTGLHSELACECSCKHRHSELACECVCKHRHQLLGGMHVSEAIAVLTTPEKKSHIDIDCGLLQPTITQKVEESPGVLGQCALAHHSHCFWLCNRPLSLGTSVSRKPATTGVNPPSLEQKPGLMVIHLSYVCRYFNWKWEGGLI